MNDSYEEYKHLYPQDDSNEILLEVNPDQDLY
jgi:hypothetical protein